MTEEQKNFGRQLKEFRQTVGISTRELAAAGGCCHSAIVKAEGKSRGVSSKILTGLLKIVRGRNELFCRKYKVLLSLTTGRRGEVKLIRDNQQIAAGFNSLAGIVQAEVRLFELDKKWLSSCGARMSDVFKKARNKRPRLKQVLSGGE
jgi:hypothetical protein